MKYGISVSERQGTIDWGKVSNSVDFAIVCIGSRGYEPNGELRQDPHYRDNMEGAIAAGLPLGAFFFSQAINAAEAAGEARFCLRLLEGYNLCYPIYFVAGYSGHPQQRGRADCISCADRTRAAASFCQTMEDAGYYAGVCTSASFARQGLIDYGALAQHYAMWLSDFRLNYGRRLLWGMHRFSSLARIDGIDTEVDLNRCALDYPWIIQKAGLSGSGNTGARAMPFGKTREGTISVAF